MDGREDACVGAGGCLTLRLEVADSLGVLDVRMPVVAQAVCNGGVGSVLLLLGLVVCGPDCRKRRMRDSAAQMRPQHRGTRIMG